MSLAKIISQEIQEDLNAYKEEEHRKLAELRDTNEEKLNLLQREYNEVIQANVDEQVQLRTYAVKRQSAFQKVEGIASHIQKAYINALPRILETSFFAKELDRFLDQCPKGTRLTVSGTYSEALTAALKKRNCSDITVQEGQGVGSIVFTTKDTEAEFTLEDIVEQAKLLTIDKVMQLLSTHD